MLMTFAQSLSETSLHSWVVSQTWLWPTLEVTHFFGLTLLIGGLLVVDLRVLGAAASSPLLATYRLLPIVLVGFGLNLITGVLFIFGDPFRYAANIGFQAKMIIICLAGANALYHHLKVTPLLSAASLSADVPMVAKVSAAASLLAWTTVLLLGRLIPYVGTG
jgi:hypothetical protein